VRATIVPGDRSMCLPRVTFLRQGGRYRWQFFALQS